MTLPATTTGTVTVRHRGGAYLAYVEAGLLVRLEELVSAHVPARRLAVIADAAVAGRVPLPLASDLLVVPSGEASKSRDTWASLTDDLLERGFGRDSAIVAFGGGMVGDLAGFVAATYHRGIPWMQVPTTLLAMLDASVGGKTGVDTSLGKNLVGAFHQPVAVVADPAVLLTLPERAYRSGLAEAVKHGVIADAGYLAWIRDTAEGLVRRDPQALARLIERSITIKADVIADDETEQGRRATLNAGHTVAHAIELVSGFEVPHGEAVAIGLVTECRIAERLGLAETGLAGTVADVLVRLGLPTDMPGGLPPDDLLRAMAHDKKNRGSELRFALPRGVGSMVQTAGEWTVAVPKGAVLNAL